MAGKINKTGYTIINGMKLPAAAASYKIDYVLLKKLLKYKKFKCNKCNNVIVLININNRSTYYCSNCQR